MSNKLSPVRTKIETALKTLVVSGDLKAVKRGAINMLEEPSLPVLGIAEGRFWRKGSCWTEILELRIGVKSSDGTLDDAIELSALIEGKLETLINSGTAGGVIQKPTFDCWHNVTGNKNAIVVIKASVEITVETPLAS